eukprot:4109128-Amphidinium_carterae.1
MLAVSRQDELGTLLAAASPINHKLPQHKLSSTVSTITVPSQALALCYLPCHARRTNFRSSYMGQ